MCTYRLWPSLIDIWLCLLYKYKQGLFDWSSIINLKCMKIIPWTLLIFLLQPISQSIVLQFTIDYDLFSFQYKRQSTDGLSLLMFLLAILGNITYGLSILVRSVEVDWLIQHLPWLVGSLGVVLLDISVSLKLKCNWIIIPLANKVFRNHPVCLSIYLFWSYI